MQMLGGKLPDFALVDRDVLTVTAEEARDTKARFLPSSYLVRDTQPSAINLLSSSPSASC